MVKKSEYVLDSEVTSEEKTTEAVTTEAPATTPETGENNTPEPAQTEPAQTETAHEAVTGENGGPGVVPTTAAQPAGENAGAESPASPAQEENP